MRSIPHRACLLQSRHQLSSIAAAEQMHPRLGDLLETGLDNMFALVDLQLAVRQRFLQRLQRLTVLAGVLQGPRSAIRLGSCAQYPGDVDLHSAR